MTANLIVAFASFFIGWVALFPLRRTLGSALTHLSALPVGLIGWTMVIVVTTTLNTPPTAPLMAGGVMLYIALIAGTGLVLRGPAQFKVGWRSYAFAGLAYAAFVALFAILRLTIVSFDSYGHYEISGWYLYDTGLLTVQIMGSRGPLVPAMHMANRFFGSDWLFLVYPLISANALMVLGYAVWEHAFARFERNLRIIATALATVAVATSPAWVFHTWHVHSNMVSSLYMTLSVFTILAGAGVFRRTERDPLPTSAGIVAGLALAGLVFARPDGPAYAFVGLSLIAVCHILGYVDRKVVGNVYAGFLPIMVIVIGTAISQVGIWTSEKLSGRTVVALLVAAAIFGVVTVAIPRITSLSRFIKRIGVFRLAAILNFSAIILVMIRTRNTLLTLRIMVIDLFGLVGGWGLTWWFLLLGLVLTVAYWQRGNGLIWRQMLLYSTLQFLGIALVVHGAMKPGLLEYMDSFTRVVLHIVPVAAWYLAAWAGSAWMPTPELAEESPKGS